MKDLLGNLLACIGLLAPFVLGIFCMIEYPRLRLIFAGIFALLLFFWALGHVAAGHMHRKSLANLSPVQKRERAKEYRATADILEAEAEKTEFDQSA